MLKFSKRFSTMCKQNIIIAAIRFSDSKWVWKWNHHCASWNAGKIVEIICIMYHHAFLPSLLRPRLALNNNPKRIIFSRPFILLPFHFIFHFYLKLVSQIKINFTWIRIKSSRNSFATFPSTKPEKAGSPTLEGRKRKWGRTKPVKKSDRDENDDGDQDDSDDDDYDMMMTSVQAMKHFYYKFNFGF